MAWNDAKLLSIYIMKGRSEEMVALLVHSRKKRIFTSFVEGMIIGADASFIVQKVYKYLLNKKDKSNPAFDSPKENLLQDTSKYDQSNIKPITNRDGNTIECLLAIWESAVRATHLFLSEQDVADIKPEAEQGLLHVEHLYGYYTESNELMGFIGVQEQKIELLFIDNKKRRQGIGQKLTEFVFINLNVKFVDVNEQNPQAVEFYKHMGFKMMNRSEFDDSGRPFPILHMKKIDTN